MSKVAVVTSFPPSWSKLADITTATQRAWCDRHGLDYFTDCSDVRDRANRPIAGFIKLDLLSHFLGEREYDAAIWLDADLVIRNFLIEPFELGKPLTFDPRSRRPMLPYDFNGHNATVMFFTNTRLTRAFLWACNNAGRTMFLGHDWKEMEAMRYFLQTPPYHDWVTYRSAKALCPILAKEYEPAVPAWVSAPYAYEIGDWSCHLSALHIDRRVQLARDLLNGT